MSSDAAPQMVKHNLGVEHNSRFHVFFREMELWLAVGASDRVGKPVLGSYIAFDTQHRPFHYGKHLEIFS